MGPQSDNRGYFILEEIAEDISEASMGPQSDNRGYELPAPLSYHAKAEMLQGFMDFPTQPDGPWALKCLCGLKGLEEFVK